MAAFERPVLVTGAAGCIGAWVVAALLRDGSPVSVFDLSENRHRLRQLLSDEEIAAIPWHLGDIADTEALGRVVAEHEVGAIVHLAALQVPFCKADPVAGARVNVVGQINVLEAARRHRVRHLVYASSIAAVPLAGAAHPSTLYGVYKAAGEGAARIYWRDWSVPSIGLRPHTVYGLGRDQGLTSAPTKAMLAAAAGWTYTIPFAGSLQFQFAEDVARVVLRCAAADVEGAPVFNLGGAPVKVEEIVTAIRREVPEAEVGCSGEPLPFPYDQDGAPLYRLIGEAPATPLPRGVAATIDAYRGLLARGLVTPEDPGSGG